MRSKRISAGILSGIVCIFHPITSLAQTNASAGASEPLQDRIKNLEEALNFTEQRLAKEISDIVWQQRLQEIAEVDKVRFTGPPPRLTNNPTEQGAGNPVIITAYPFLPKKFLSAPK